MVPRKPFALTKDLVTSAELWQRLVYFVVCVRLVMELSGSESRSSSSSKEDDFELTISSDNDLSEGESGVFLIMSLTHATINDPCCPEIKIDSLALAVIDTLEFQRLRSVKQCGVCDLVYPSAVHTRFEHSIGVYHWADKLMLQLRGSKADPLTECVKLAGLCHDLGHGPFSHLWEKFVHKIGIPWKHETQSVAVFKRLVQKNHLMEKFASAGLTAKHVELVCSLILGNVDADGELQEITGAEPFHYEIINNNETGIDVDKWEYMQRDAFYFGMKFTMDAYRVLNNAVLVGDVGQRRIAFREKSADEILELFEFRCKLHKKCYQHRVCKNVEVMLVDAMVAAKDHAFYHVEGVDGRVKLSEIHEEKNLDFFVQSNDTIFQTILHSTDPNLKKSKEIVSRMMSRDLYTLISERKMPSSLARRFRREEISLGDFEHCLEQTLNGSGWAQTAQGEFRLAFVNLDMGKNEDPIERVRFVRKDGSVTFKKKAHEVQPEFFHENTSFGSLAVLVFSTKSKKVKLPSDLTAKIQCGVEKIISATLDKFHS